MTVRCNVSSHRNTKEKNASTKPCQVEEKYSCFACALNESENRLGKSLPTGLLSIELASQLAELIAINTSEMNYYMQLSRIEHSRLLYCSGLRPVSGPFEGKLRGDDHDADEQFATDDLATIFFFFQKPQL